MPAWLSNRSHASLVVLLLLMLVAGCNFNLGEEQAPAIESSPTPTVVPVTTERPSPTPSPTPTPSSVPTEEILSGRESHVTPQPTPDSPPVRLVIPALDIDTPVVEVGWEIVGTGDDRRSEWQTADYAAGHHINSANPGQRGNVVISGHHNIKGRVFEQISRDVDRNPPRLKPGSEIYVYAADGRGYVYRVKEVLLLQEVGASEAQRRENARYMDQTEEPTLTLVTCWPMWTNTHRVIVVATLDASAVAP